MEQSILKSVKKNLGLEPEYDVFDGEIITFINTAFSTLNQLGVGTPSGFFVEDDTATWGQFLSPNLMTALLGKVKTYIYLRVRLIFDPPATAYVLKSFEAQIQELEWRISAMRESADWLDPSVVVVPGDEDVVIDGGNAAAWG